MKAADFDYFAPPDLQEALRILVSRSGETRVMAGGQSLLPLLKARLSSPSRWGPRPHSSLDRNRLMTARSARTLVRQPLGARIRNWWLPSPCSPGGPQDR